MLNPLHSLALARVEDKSNYYLIQWWCHKYSRPSNDPLLLSLTWEELYLEYLTWFYSENPEEVKKAKIKEEVKKWSGETSDEYEESIKDKLQKIQNFDLSRWQEDSKDEDEFDDVFD